MPAPRTPAVILSEEGTVIARIDTDIPSGEIQYAANSISGVGALINPRNGKLSREPEHLATPCEATARCVHRSLRRFVVEERS